MIRTDRKTGAPILSPKLSPDQLHAMADDPGWRPWMHLIASHPHAWPELVAWWRHAQREGFDAAGAAPPPPESMRGRGRVVMPQAPLPPENTTEGNPSAATEPSHATEGRDEADGGFAGLDESAGPEPVTEDIPPIPESTDARTGEEAHGAERTSADKRGRAIPRRTVGLAVAVVLVTALTAAGGIMLAHRYGEEAAREALSQAANDCDRAHDAAVGRRKTLERMMEKARGLISSTDSGQVADQSTLDRLGRLAGKEIPDLPACSATAPDADPIASTARRYELDAKALGDAMDEVNESILDKTVADARRLYDDSAGKVADERTRTDLAQAIDRRDGEAIRDAMDEVNESVKAKTDADRAKAETEAERARQEQSPIPSPSAGGSDAYVAPAPSAPVPSAPAPALQEQAPAPSMPSTSPKPSGSDGAVVG